jgi:hypothetical protein
MTIETRLRMTGGQYSVMLDILKENPAAYGYCGFGFHETDDAYRYSFSVYGDFSAKANNDPKYKKLISIKVTVGDGAKDTDDKQKPCYPLDRTDIQELSVSVSSSDHSIFARLTNSKGSFNIDKVSVAGSDIFFWDHDKSACFDRNIGQSALQAFGELTISILSKLCIGIVGVSGTGSIVTELLYRLGSGSIVLVDNDITEERNLNRIINSHVGHAGSQTLKVEVQKEAIDRSGLNVSAEPIGTDLMVPETIRRLSQCDVIFGCMDSVDGRHVLNKLCTYYCIPYFDLGVGLDADGRGGIRQIAGAVHYLIPGTSSLKTRGVYTDEDLYSAIMKRDDPEQYRSQLKEKYIKGVDEERPAVISVNTLIASLAVNDFLARLHPYRDDPNEDIEAIVFSLSQMRFAGLNDKYTKDEYLSRYAGIGDSSPLLGMTGLSEVKEQ